MTTDNRFMATEMWELSIVPEIQFSEIGWETQYCWQNSDPKIIVFEENWIVILCRSIQEILTTIGSDLVEK